MTESRTLSLIVRRIIPARPARLFEAWTTTAQLQAWWGPRGVQCTHAEIDARPGGRYRIENTLPDGRVVWIFGEFLAVDPPDRLVYTWTIEPGSAQPERVTVRFVAHASGTEVVVVHEHIGDERTRDEHAEGWTGCLDRLAAHVSGAAG